ncbi:MAG: UbiA family prenyltransferase [Candidatus Aenigmarchaeota archaeon]|nr:UbiA family prenyltransferase [Candidatus Aenigmarchaeota archaeon]
MIKEALQLLLPEHAIIVVSGIITSTIIASNALPNPSTIIVPILSFSLLVFGFNALNAIFDLNIDKINKPLRPVPQGKITKKQTITISVIVNLIGIFAAYTVSINFLLLALLFTLIGVLYSVPPARIKKRVFGSNMVIGIIYGLIPFFTGFILVGNYNIPLYLIIYFTIIAALISSMKDFEDHIGDSLHKVKTVPVVLGTQKAAKRVGESILFVASAFLILTTYIGMNRLIIASAVALLVAVVISVYLLNVAKNIDKILTQNIIYESHIARVGIAFGILIQIVFAIAFI